MCLQPRQMNNDLDMRHTWDTDTDTGRPCRQEHHATADKSIMQLQHITPVHHRGDGVDDHRTEQRTEKGHHGPQVGEDDGRACTCKEEANSDGILQLLARRLVVYQLQERPTAPRESKV